MSMRFLSGQGPQSLTVDSGDYENNESTCRARNINMTITTTNLI